MWKADAKSAFRIIPAKPLHWQFLGVAFRNGVQVIASNNFAMPFGMVASVYAWDRIGDLMWRIGTKWPNLPL